MKKGEVAFGLGLIVSAATYPFAAVAQTGALAESGNAAAQVNPAVELPASAGAPAPVQQSQPASDVPGDIVVTALRGNTVLQRTPAAVTALSGAELSSRGISTVEDLAAVVPAVSFGKNIGQVSISVRGIGSDGVSALQDPRVGFYQDGVYIARPDAQNAGLFDVESVQVLKGPQGTLYGRNATGGAVVVTSARPTFDTNGYVRAGYGNYNAANVDFAVGGPASDTVAVRIAGHYSRHDGYGRNLVTGTDIDDENQLGVRASVLWKPVDGLEFLTIGDYAYESDRGNALHYFGQAQPGLVPRGLLLGGTALQRSRDIASDNDPSLSLRSYGVTEQITYDAGWGKIKSITGYREVSTSNTVDVDGTSLRLGIDHLFDNASQVSQEVTIDGKFGRFGYLVGGQYFHESIGPAGTEIPLSGTLFGGTPALTDGFATLGYQKTNSFAGYGQLSYEIIDGLTLTGGGRYSTEKKDINNTFQLDRTRPYTPGFNDITPNPGYPRIDSARFSRFTPTASITYQVTPQIFAFFNYSQGFKSGGYAIGDNRPAYRPEKITDYEGGIKTTLLGGTLTANIIGFHYDYTDLQVTLVRSNQTFIENAAAATVDGFEFETSVHPMHGLTIGGNVAYVDARYQDYSTSDPSKPANTPAEDLSGNQLSQAPKVTFLVYGDKTWDVGDYKLKVHGDYSYKSKQFFTPFNNDLVSQGSYGIGSASVRLDNVAGWYVEGYVRNIGNTLAASQLYVSSLGLFNAPVLGTLVAPRTYGFTLGYNF